MVKSIAATGIDQNTYKQRAITLEEMFGHDTLKSGTCQANAACNVSHIAMTTMKQAVIPPVHLSAPLIVAIAIK